MIGQAARVWGACAYWARRYVGGQLNMKVDAWLARSAPQQILDGFLLVDFEQEGASEEYFTGLRDALRLIEFYDPPRYRRVQRYLWWIAVSEEIPAAAMFMLGTRTCMIRPSLVRRVESELDARKVGSHMGSARPDAGHRITARPPSKSAGRHAGPGLSELRDRRPVRASTSGPPRATRRR